MRNRLVIVIIVAPLLALGAGIAGGMLLLRIPHEHAGGSTEADSLTTELNLTVNQREQMREIWEAARQDVRKTIQQAQQLQTERDDAILALLDPEKKAAFAEISKRFAERDQKLLQDRDAVFKDAVRRTKSLLSEEQWEKYERILRAQVRGVHDMLPED